MTTFSNHSRIWRSAFFATGPVAAAAVLGNLATTPNLVPWYAHLAKPAFNPPNWLFAPVWTTLYVLMAFAFWRILQMRLTTPGRRAAIWTFLAQLALNAAWPWLFFAGHDPRTGFFEIVVQFVAVLAALMEFRRLDRLAGWCLVPLAFWVGFATILNLAIWRLNGG